MDSLQSQSYALESRRWDFPSRRGQNAIFVKCSFCENREILKSASRSDDSVIFENYHACWGAPKCAPRHVIRDQKYIAGIGYNPKKLLSLYCTNQNSASTSASTLKLNRNTKCANSNPNRKINLRFKTKHQTRSRNSTSWRTLNPAPSEICNLHCRINLKIETQTQNLTSTSTSNSEPKLNRNIKT